MSFDFPIETIIEGKVKAVVPKLAIYTKRSREHAPSKAPVFYNPTMELNRDFAVLALQTYQRSVERKISVCEPLTGCGLRGARFAIEVEEVRKIFLNDIKPEAARLARYNAELNNAADRIAVANEDANLFLSKNAAPKKRFDYIDIDPFGTPVPYLDSAIRALRNGGLLALTATDMAPLCGVHPRACLRKYGGKPLRTEYCHELAVRLLIGCLTMMAAKHAIGIEALFSYSVDHYVRAYTVVNHGAKASDKSVKQMGYILHCFSCFHREKSQGIASFHKDVCPSCGAKLSVAGPLWLGDIAKNSFCLSMEKEVERKNLRQQRRLLKMLSLIKDEVEGPITYYTIDRICDKMNLPIPPLKKVISKIGDAGFQAVLTHFKSTGLRTDAPANFLKETVATVGRNRE